MNGLMIASLGFFTARLSFLKRVIFLEVDCLGNRFIQAPWRCDTKPPNGKLEVIEITEVEN